MKKAVDVRTRLIAFATTISFVVLLLCIIFISVSARRSFERSAQEELAQAQHNMSLSFAVSLNEQKALVLQMAKSSTIIAYMESPADKAMWNRAVAEFDSYRSSFLSNSVVKNPVGTSVGMVG